VIGRFSLFAPAFQRGQEIRPIRPDSAPTMPHARHQEQSHPVVLTPAEFRADRRKIVDGVLRRGTGIGPAVIEQKLSTPRLEVRKVRVGGFDECRVLHRQREVRLELERHHVPVRVLMSDKSRRVREQRIRRRARRRHPVTRFEARSTARINHLAGPGLHRLPGALSGLDLRGGETTSLIAPRAQQNLRIEPARLRIGDDAVLHTVSCVACSHHGTCQQRHLVGRQDAQPTVCSGGRRY
jgi:hypothetical protein